MQRVWGLFRIFSVSMRSANALATQTMLSSGPYFASPLSPWCIYRLSLSLDLSGNRRKFTLVLSQTCALPVLVGIVFVIEIP